MPWMVQRQSSVRIDVGRIDVGALEFVQQYQELCSLWVSLCVCHRQLMCDQSWTGHATETPAYDSRYGPWTLVELLWRSPQHFSQDRHKIWFTLAVPLSDPPRKSPQVTYVTPNKRTWKLLTSTQLCSTWHTDSLDMVVIPSTSAWRYHNCCIDGSTSPEYFWYHNIKYPIMPAAVYYTYIWTSRSTSLTSGNTWWHWEEISHISC
jgi:hypothetical protein